MHCATIVIETGCIVMMVSTGAVEEGRMAAQGSQNSLLLCAGAAFLVI